MTVDISDKGDYVKVTVTADNGGTARASVVGEPLKNVEEQVDSIIEAHNLQQRAEDNGQS